MGYTTDRFLRGVYRRTSAPANNALDGDSDVLELADDIIRSQIVPLLISAREEFFVTPLYQALVAGQAAYDFPPRAVALSLRDLKLDIGGSSEAYRLNDVGEENEQGSRLTGNTSGYFFTGDEVNLVPPPSDSSWVLEIWHEQRPSNLVAVASAAQVASVAGDVVTLMPGAILPAIIAAGVTCDVIKGQQGHSLKGMDLVVASVTAGSTVAPVVAATITFATDTTPTGIVAGDWISLSNTSPVIQLPDEACVLLETYVAKRLFKSLGDYEAAQATTEDQKDETASLLKVIEPRNRGANKKTVNHHGLLRGRRSSIKRGYYR